MLLTNTVHTQVWPSLCLSSSYSVSSRYIFIFRYYWFGILPSLDVSVSESSHWDREEAIELERKSWRMGREWWTTNPGKLSNQYCLGLRSRSGSSRGGVGVFNSSASACGEVEDPFEVVVWHPSVFLWTYGPTYSNLDQVGVFKHILWGFCLSSLRHCLQLLILAHPICDVSSLPSDSYASSKFQCGFPSLQSAPLWKVLCITMEDCFTWTDMDLMHDELKAPGTQGSLAIHLRVILIKVAYTTFPILLGTSHL